MKSTIALESKTKAKVPYQKTSKSDFYNIKLNIISKARVFEKCTNFFDSNTTNTIFFLNAHCFNISQKNSEYHNAINKSDLLLNDGIGIRIASLLMGVRIGENLNGTDLIPEIMKLASREGKQVYLLGGMEGIAETAAKRIKESMPKIKIAGYHSGYFSDYENEFIIKQINDSGAELLVLGMGVPKQEIWAYKNLTHLTNLRIIIAGGAILDFISGHAHRAPIWIRSIHMEWMYRLYKEPKRMWKRYIIGNFLFFVHLIRLKYLSSINKPAS